MGNIPSKLVLFEIYKLTFINSQNFYIFYFAQPFELFILYNFDILMDNFEHPLNKYTVGSVVDVSI